MRRAFTLIELMAVLVLLALVAAVIGAVDARSATHNTARVWRELEFGLRRCSAIATEHGGGVLETSTLSFTAESSYNAKSSLIMEMPTGWRLGLEDVSEIRFDARGRCPDYELRIESDAGMTLSNATLDGVSMMLFSEGLGP